VSKIVPELYLRFALTLVLAAGWGFAWARFLNTEYGTWLARRRTWITVVIGLGVDLLLLPLILDLTEWLFVAAVIGASSIGIVWRSLRHEHDDEENAWHALETTARE
jgi:hypothetical protein